MRFGDEFPACREAIRLGVAGVGEDLGLGCHDTIYY
jgi:hypothetical protein